MSTPRAAPEAGRAPCATDRPARRPRPALRAALLPCLCLLLALPAPQRVRSQALAASAAATEQIIVTVTVNGVPRGEFRVARGPGGDFWIRAEDATRLQVPLREEARREGEGESWYSARGLGATALQLQEEALALALMFQPQALPGSRIDLSTRPPPLARPAAHDSLVLSYRLGAIQAANTGLEFQGLTDLNIRANGVLLRQEMRIDTTRRKAVARGATQLVWDDLANARRFVAGDVVSSAGPYGSTITGAGLQLLKVYELAPDVVRHPTAHLRATTALPAEVEVTVDGTPVFRGRVAPGPVVLDNLLAGGGLRNVRVVITDAAGRQEVIERPFLFTDTVLARGFHEYSYFAGARSELDPDSRLRYRERAWQAWHRYGASDSVTLSAGGEGSSAFRTAGAGVTLRSDPVGLLALDLLHHSDRPARTEARGWSVRYTYLTPAGSLVLGRRRFGDGFRSFATGIAAPFPRSDTRIGFATGLGRASVSADYVRTVTEKDVRETGFVRFGTSLARGVLLMGEWQTTRVDQRKGWALNVYLRAELGRDRWVSANTRLEHDRRRVETEAGQLLPEGEGFGYRVGAATSWDRGGAKAATLGYGSAQWNLRPLSVGLFATAPLQGDATSYLQADVAGALVGIGGYWGFTRQVSDAFVLARLGVPQSGVEVFLNSQPQGRTDAGGRLLIPQVSSFGRQELSVDERSLPIQYTLREPRRTIALPWRSGTVVDFGIERMRAVAGVARQVDGGQAAPVASRAWTMSGPAGRLVIETSPSGEFYLEDAPPGRYTGTLQGQGRSYACRLVVPASEEAVQELKEGIVCE